MGNDFKQASRIIKQFFDLPFERSDSLMFNVIVDYKDKVLKLFNCLNSDLFKNTIRKFYYKFCNSMYLKRETLKKFLMNIFISGLSTQSLKTETYCHETINLNCIMVDDDIICEESIIHQLHVFLFEVILNSQEDCNESEKHFEVVKKCIMLWKFDKKTIDTI